MKPEFNVVVLALFAIVLVGMAIHSGNTWVQGMAGTAFSTLCLAMHISGSSNGGPP